MYKRFGFFALGLAMLLALAVPALADSFNDADSIQYAIDSYYWNDCTAEAVHVTGTLHMVLRSSNDGNGRYHFRFHENYQNLAGTGMSTGAEYRVPGADNTTLNWDFSWTGGQEAFTEVHQLRFIAQGQDEDTFLRTVIHVTVDANDELRVDLEDVQLVCN
jgi:hypothetical protein